MNNEHFAYIRVSTVKQGDGVSLEAQRDAIITYAAQNGLMISRWFEEKVTAAKTGRPQFTELVKLLKQGRARGVLMHKIDRSARNLRDWAAVGELQDSGIEVHFAAENVDFTTNGGRLTADIHAVMAAHYIRNLREETLKGINGRLKQGLYPFKAPIGYLDNGKGKPKTICPEKGPKVRHLYKCYASGEYSLWALVDEAERIGLKSFRGGKVTKTCIEWMLKNPFYIGLIHVKSRNQTFKGIHTPLISSTLFRRATEVREGKKAQKKTRHDHLYRRMFHCAVCHKTFIPERQKGHVYYRCHSKSCAGSTLREEVLDHSVAGILTSIELDQFQTNTLHERLNAWARHVLKTEPDTSQKTEMARIQRTQDKLLDALLEGLIDKETYERRKAQFLVQEQELSKANHNHLSAEAFTRNLSDLLELLKSLYLTYSMANFSEKRRLLKIMTSNRQITGKNVELTTKNWVQETQSFVSVLFGPHSTDNPRTQQNVRFPEHDALRTFFLSEDWNDLKELCRDIGDRDSVESEPELEHPDCYGKAA